MLCCGKCGKNLRLEDHHFEIMISRPMHDNDLATEGEMCVFCTNDLLGPLLGRGRRLTGQDRIAPEVGLAATRVPLKSRVS